MLVEALGPFELAFVDQPLAAHGLQRLVDRAGRLELGFRGEDVVVDAEQAEVVADQFEHRRDRAGAEQGSHSASGAAA